MRGESLESFFEGYIDKPSIFKNKNVLRSSYTPTNIPHREKQKHHIAQILAPALKQERPSNLFVYGKTGTGKTLTVRHVVTKVQETAQKNNIPISTIYLNCKMKKIADTEYRIMAQLARELKREVPATGLPTEEVYKIFYKAVDAEKKTLLIVLDELDQLIKKTGDGVLYNLTRINEELKNSQITIIGISNDLLFLDNLDPRVRSSLSEEELVFPPYNAIQIKHILEERAKEAFRNTTLQPGVLEKCAAYSAREHGDARRALELLRVAGELTDRDQQTKVSVDYIDKAQGRIEEDKIVEVVRTQPRQSQVIAFAILSLGSGKNKIFTGQIYNLYADLCRKLGMSVLTQRRVSDMISELDMLGIINAKIISNGRYGRTREINPSTRSAMFRAIGTSTVSNGSNPLALAFCAIP